MNTTVTMIDTLKRQATDDGGQRPPKIARLDNSTERKRILLPSTARPFPNPCSIPDIGVNTILTKKPDISKITSILGGLGQSKFHAGFLDMLPRITKKGPLVTSLSKAPTATADGIPGNSSAIDSTIAHIHAAEDSDDEVLFEDALKDSNRQQSLRNAKPQLHSPRVSPLKVTTSAIPEQSIATSCKPIADTDPDKNTTSSSQSSSSAASFAHPPLDFPQVRTAPRMPTVSIKQADRILGFGPVSTTHTVSESYKRLKAAQEKEEQGLKSTQEKEEQGLKDAQEKEEQNDSASSESEDLFDFLPTSTPEAQERARRAIMQLRECLKSSSSLVENMYRQDLLITALRLDGKSGKYIADALRDLYGFRCEREYPTSRYRRLRDSMPELATLEKTSLQRSSTTQAVDSAPPIDFLAPDSANTQAARDAIMKVKGLLGTALPEDMTQEDMLIVSYKLDGRLANYIISQLQSLFGVRRTLDWCSKRYNKLCDTIPELNQLQEEKAGLGRRHLSILDTQHDSKDFLIADTPEALKAQGAIARLKNAIGEEQVEAMHPQDMLLVAYKLDGHYAKTIARELKILLNFDCTAEWVNRRYLHLSDMKPEITKISSRVKMEGTQVMNERARKLPEALKAHEALARLKDTIGEEQVEMMSPQDMLVVAYRLDGQSAPTIARELKALLNIDRPVDWVYRRFYQIQDTWPEIAKISTHVKRSRTYDNSSKHSSQAIPASTQQVHEAVVGVEQRPTTGGKTIWPGQDEWTLDHGEYDDHEDEYNQWQGGHSNSRQTSPEAEDDKIHFVYQIKRRAVSRCPEQIYDDDENEDEEPEDDEDSWIICGEYEALDEANAQAVHELFKERKGVGIANDGARSTTIKELDECHMLHASATTENVKVQVKVTRYLRTYQDGIMPANKKHWLPRKLWYVRETKRYMGTTLPTPGGSSSSQASDEANSEHGSAEDEVTSTAPSDEQVQIPDIELTVTIGTTLDAANRHAGRRVIEFRRQLDLEYKRKTLDNDERETKEKDEMDEKLNELEEENMPFNEVVTGMEEVLKPGEQGRKKRRGEAVEMRMVEVRVEVVEAPFVGPRNI